MVESLWSRFFWLTMQVEFSNCAAAGVVGKRSLLIQHTSSTARHRAARSHRENASIMGRTDRLSHARPRVPDCGAIHQYTCRQLQYDVTQFTRLILPGSIKSTQPTLCKCRLACLLTFFATVNDFWHRQDMRKMKMYKVIVD